MREEYPRVNLEENSRSEERKELAKESEKKCSQKQEKIQEAMMSQTTDISIGDECSGMSYTTENLCKMQT